MTAPATAAVPSRALRPLGGADLEAWSEAQRFWDASVALRPPLVLEEGEDVAYIDLATRETRVNTALLERLGLRDRLLCVLTHEVGHHIRYPHTLLAARRLHVFLRAELPALLTSCGARAGGAAHANAAGAAREAAAGRYDFLVNLLLDVLINRDMAQEDPRAPGFLEDFIAIYRRLVTDRPGRAAGGEPVMAFYLAVYQSLWYLRDATLLSPPMLAALDAASPTWREDAADLVRFLETHRGLPLRQLAKLMVAFAPFLLAEPAERTRRAGAACLEGNEGLGGALDPREAGRLVEEDRETRAARRILAPASGDDGEREEEAATGRARGRGGKRPEAAGGGGERRGPAKAGFPGGATLDALRGIVPPTEAVLAWYRAASRRLSFELPRGARADEAVVVGPTETWEGGQDLASIDWRATVLAGGGVAIPGVTTRRRTWLDDDPVRGRAIEPWIELWVDSSGSMPNPARLLNPQTLAGFALVACAAESGGRFRVVQFSGPGEVKAMADFTSSPEPAQRALLEYIGSGTMFPFALLAASVERWRRRARVFRVVISDADFLHNVFHTPGRAGQGDLDARLGALRRASSGGDRIVALLVAGVLPSQAADLAAAGVEVVAVPDRADLHGAAEALGRRLFPSGDAAEGRP